MVRSELELLTDLEGFESAQICNLRPETKEAALSLVPTLQRLVVQGRENVISRAIDIVLKNRD
jgi:hypothetical protein